jgi:DNA-binding transcriptional LysR family regulator
MPQPRLSGLTFPLLTLRSPGMSNERLTIGELIMVDRVLHLAEGEADVAFRTAPPQDNTLVSRKLADVAWALFASRSYVENHGQPERAKDINRQVIGFGGLIAEHPAAHGVLRYSSLRRSKPSAHCWLDAPDHRRNAGMSYRCPCNAIHLRSGS